MLDPAQRQVIREVLDWLDRPAFAVTRQQSGSYHYIACNTAYGEICTLNETTLENSPLATGFALGEAAKLQPILDAIYETNTRKSCDLVLRWADGWLCQSVSVSPIRIAPTGPILAAVVIADIADPAALRDPALQVAENKLHDFSELASDWFWETDAEHRFTWISESASDTNNRQRERFINKHRWDVAGTADAEESFWEAHRRTLDAHEPFQGLRYCMLTENGDEIWIEINGKPIFADDGRFMGYRGSGRDITEQYHQQRRMEAALRRAEEASRAKSQFLANMSHELRTPLNAIIGFSEIIRDQMFGSVGVPRYVDYARDINASGTHLLALIGDILDMSRIEAGYYALDEKPVDLSAVIASALTMVRPQAERAGSILRNLCPENLPQLRADERVVKQVLINLLGNAVKFTPAGGTIDVIYRPDDDGSLTLCVVDTGIGITPERLEQIFEPFQLAKAEVARQHGGTGLGLSISKRLMELHGGTLGMASKVGSGTEARMSFPGWRLLDEIDKDWLPTTPEPALPPSRPAPRATAEDSKPSEPRHFGNSAGETLRILLETMGEGVIMIDRQGMIVSVSTVGAQLFGYDALDLVGQNVRILMPEPFRSGHDSYIRNYLSTHRAKVLGIGRDTLGRRKSGEIFPIHISVGEFDADGGEPGFIGVIRDISDRRDVELKAEYASRNDPLTGVLNRSNFISEAERMLAAPHRQGMGMGMAAVESKWVVFNLDIDAFRDINEGFGYHIGDLVLKTVAERLGDALPREAMVGRIAADQFAALAAVADLKHAMELAQALYDRLTQHVAVEGRVVPLKVSVGAALIDDPSEKLAEALAKAELAQKLVRNSGGNNTRFYSIEIARAAERRLRLTLNLNSAIEKSEFHLVYQPIVAASSGALAAMEVLLRWEHPELGAVSPSEFIPLAEESGLIVPITRWVIERAADQVREWRRAGIEPRRVFINVSGQQFVRDDLPAYFRALAEREPELMPYLGIEITEQAAIQNMSETVRAIRELAEVGIDTALDDFGTGYSSLSYIQQLPIRKIKLDRAFITDLPGNEKDVALVRAMVGMASGLALPVVAEGVETEVQREFLRAAGCSELQGFLISKPISPQEMAEMLEASDRRKH